MPITELIILSFAVWRIASLFVHEDGPLYIFRKLRELAGITHDAEGDHLIVPETFICQLLSCVWCFSIWVSIFMVVCLYFLPDATILIALPFALSGIAVWINSAVHKTYI